MFAVIQSASFKICSLEGSSWQETSRCTMPWPHSKYVDRRTLLYAGLVLAKIGEPRFDSGMALMDESRPTFDPLAPLLPEEVCWIIDRSFACEVNNQTHVNITCPVFILCRAQMEWHSGYTLSQTIFSFLYVHSLRETDPDLISVDDSRANDSLRSLELITVVLRASVFGLLKCCDLSWRELNKGNVYDVRHMTSLITSSTSFALRLSNRRRIGRAKNVMCLYRRPCL